MCNKQKFPTGRCYYTFCYTSPAVKRNRSREFPRYTNEMNVTEVQRARIEKVCNDRKIGRLAVFGSHARGTATQESDLDLLVEFLPGATPGYFALAELAQTLSNVFNGARVDLRTPKDLSRHFRQDVQDQAKVLYAASNPVRGHSEPPQSAARKA